MVQSEMKAEGKKISIKKLCQWFAVARSTVYYKPQRTHPRALRPLDVFLTGEVRKVIKSNPTFGVRRVTVMVRKALNRAINRKTIHRIMKINGWQIRKRSSGFKRRAKSMKSQTAQPNERWAIDASSVFCGKDSWCPLTAVIDCCDRCIVGWRLSGSGIAKNAAATLEDALVSRKEEVVSGRLTVRSDNGLVFRSKAFVAVVNRYEIGQEYITPYTPEQNGMIERFFRTLKEECVWQHCFKSGDEAFEVIAEWMQRYHNARPHSALGYQTPEEFRRGLIAA